jgi:Fe-S cluster assembly iron-binding protein IscA
MEITDAAIETLKKVIKEEGKGSCLRIFMTEGCCGPSLAMDLAPKPDKDDAETVKNDFKLYVHKAAAPMLEKAIIDCDAAGGIILKGQPSHGCGDSCGGGEGDCGCGH